jgi:glucokinase
MSNSSPGASRPAIGLDIGGTKILGVVLAADGTVLAELREPSPVQAFDALVDACARLVDRLAAEADASDAPVGVGAAGLVDLHGRLAYAPNIPGVRDAPIQDALARATGRHVVVDNDANVAALGEIACGAAIGLRTALLVTLGTGIGGGIIVDGDIYRGANGYGGEIGHVTVERDGPLCACGERGHWEAIASGNALGRMARELVERGGGAEILAQAGGVVDAVSGVEVEVAARSGDADALALLGRYADNIAIGLANLANILDPEVIVIAGGMVELGPLLFEPLVAAFNERIEGGEYRPDVPIRPAALGERAGAIGAAVLAQRVRA